MIDIKALEVVMEIVLFPAVMHSPTIIKWGNHTLLLIVVILNDSKNRRQCLHSLHFSMQTIACVFLYHIYS